MLADICQVHYTRYARRAHKEAKRKRRHSPGKTLKIKKNRNVESCVRIEKLMRYFPTSLCLVLEPPPRSDSLKKTSVRFLFSAAPGYSVQKTRYKCAGYYLIDDQICKLRDAWHVGRAFPISLAYYVRAATWKPCRQML